MTAPLDTQAARVARLLTGGHVAGAAPPGRFGKADAWLVQRGSERLVLKRGRPEQDEADVTWEHDHLGRLASAGFPASVPVPAFDGQSWLRVDDRIWAVLGFVPGHALVLDPTPDLAMAGAFLARYHQATRAISLPEQRPTVTGLMDLFDAMPWDRI